MSDDDDDFGFDDDIFDAADLAKIDEIEHKYVAASQQPTAYSSLISSKPSTNNVSNIPTKPSQDRFIRPLPPAKRLRTNEWNVTSLPNREYNVQEEEDDTPTYAVVAAKDGKYRIVDSSDPPPRTTSLAVPSTSALSTGSQKTRVGGQHARPMASQRQDASSSSSFPRTGRGIGTQSATASSSASRNVGSSQSRFAAITAALKETRLGEDDDEMEALRAQVAELRIANEVATAALRVAHEEKLTKEGEISTIRRNMANLKESQAQLVAKLQAEKLAIEEKRKQSERQTKQEMERLQSSFALRRQEIETSTRKTPWSVRKQRGAGPTPGGPGASHFRPVALANETPSRPARLRIPEPHGNANANNASQKDKGKGKGPAFPAFVDSFQSTSPVKTPSKTQRENGGRGGGDRSAGPWEVPDMDTIFPPFPSLENVPTPTAHSAPKRSRAISFSRKSASMASARSAAEEESGPDWAESFEPGPLVLEFEGRSGGTLEEEAEVQDEMLEGDVEEEEEEPLETLDLKEQLYRILFSHISLPLYQLTLQILLSTQIPEEHREYTSTYVKASSALVEALAPKSLEYGTVLQLVVKALLRMARILCDTSSMVALAGTFNLLATMCLFLPKTTSLLLPEEIYDPTPPVLHLVIEVVKTHAVPKGPLSAENELLIKECLNFLEVLCLTVPTDLLMQMQCVVVEPTFVSHLLDGRQPLWILQSTVQSLSNLSTYEEAPAILLVPPRESRDRKIPLLERLSYMLVEPIAIASLKDQHSLQISILTIFTQLAISSPDTLSTLVQSQALIPALVANLNNYSARAWEEDEDIYDEPSLLLQVSNSSAPGYLLIYTSGSLSHIIQGTLRLLHYLVFKGGPQVHLQQKIQYPPPKMNGLEHMFVVGLGRLSYADPPEWQSKVAREALENGAILARDLLETVVNGLEVDAIWTSFQDSEDNPGSETDDEEMEARKVAQEDDMILVD